MVRVVSTGHRVRGAGRSPGSGPAPWTGTRAGTPRAGNARPLPTRGLTLATPGHSGLKQLLPAPGRGSEPDVRRTEMCRTGSVPKEVGFAHDRDGSGATLLGFCGNGSLRTEGKPPPLTSQAGTGEMCGELRAQFPCPRGSIASIVQTSGAVADKTERPTTLRLLVI